MLDSRPARSPSYDRALAMETGAVGASFAFASGAAASIVISSRRVMTPAYSTSRAGARNIQVASYAFWGSFPVTWRSFDRLRNISRTLLRRRRRSALEQLLLFKHPVPHT